MSHRLLPYLISFFVLFLSINPFSLAKAQDKPVNVEELIQYALENSREVHKARLEIKEAQTLIQQAQAGRGFHSDFIFDLDRQKTPSYLETLYSFTGEEVGKSYSSYSGTIALSTVIRDTLDTKAPVQKARLTEKEALSSLQQARFSVTKQTLEAAFDVFQARNGIELAQLALLNREASLERVRREKEEGTAVERDVREAELDVEKAKNTLQTAHRLLDLVQENLSRVTGLSPDQITEIPSPGLPEIKELEQANPWPWNLEQMQKMALENRPELQRSLLGIELTSIELKEAKSNRFDFRIGGSYTSFENQVGLGLEMGSDYRVTGTLTHFNDTLPEVDRIQIDDDEWEDFKEAWPWETPPEWFPEKEDLEELMSFETEREDQWQIEARISINIFDSHLRKAQIEEKEIALEKAEKTHQEALEGIELEIIALYSELEDAFNSMHQASLAYDFAGQRLRETEIMVEQGIATPAEEEMAHLGKVRAENELTNKIYEFELAKAALGSALGLEIDLFLATLEIE